jgi:epoxyqueuosine reductase QueG
MPIMADQSTANDVYAFVRSLGVDAWGVASNDPQLPMAPTLPTAISLLVRLEPAELEGVELGPTPAYYAGYRRVNAALDAAASALTTALSVAGWSAEYVASTVPEDQCDAIDDWCALPVFPHKTAATQAGLGWIGKTALFVSPEFGPRVRLVTIFTDLRLQPGAAVDTGRCGACRRCVDACPAHAGVDVTWRAGLPREALYDAKACERETSSHKDLGDVCGVCIAVCLWGARGYRAAAGAALTSSDSRPASRLACLTAGPRRPVPAW